MSGDLEGMKPNIMLSVADETASVSSCNAKTQRSKILRYLNKHNTRLVLSHVQKGSCHSAFTGTSNTYF